MRRNLASSSSLLVAATATSTSPRTGGTSSPSSSSGSFGVVGSPTLHHQRRHIPMGMTTAIYGKMTPYEGFISEDITVRACEHGGPHKRGIFAKRDLSFDKEIMRVPALCYYVGEEPEKTKVREMMKWMLSRMSKDERTRSYIERRVLTLMPGSRPQFDSEDDVYRFLADVPGGEQLVRHGDITTHDIGRLASQIYYNRFEIEYNGRKGIACFPEASYFNHSCEPAVAFSFQMNLEKQYILSVRTLRPIARGEELFVHYMPGNDLPLSRFARAMRKRWGFECLCPICRSRMVSAYAVIFLLFFGPLLYTLRQQYKARQIAGARKAGLL